MYLITPPVLALDEAPGGNRLRQIAVPRLRLEGTLATFVSGKVHGWLLEAGAGGETILVVPPRTSLAKLSVSHTRAIEASLTDGKAAVVDISQGRWLRHPRLMEASALDAAVQHAGVLDSWKGAFSFVAEEPASGVLGLRAPQIGAIHAVLAHWTVSESPATVVMPTGTGKTETMLSLLVAAQCPRILVVVPTDALRSQLAEKFVTLGVLKAEGVRILGPSAAHPAVLALQHLPKSPTEVRELFKRAHVVVTTSSIAGGCDAEVQVAMADACSHLFIDEAHHAEAPTWKAFKDQFATRRVVQFTATPFRDDGKILDGRIVYAYPLRRAQEDGFFKPIRFVSIVEFNPALADRAIATRAVEQARADYSRGHVLMARVDSVARAEKVFSLYKELAPDLEPVQLHTGVKGRAREEARRKVLRREARIVVCVDMLGEGFDLPELKIAAFHDIRKSLSVTLQLAGRFTRAREDLGEATFVANTADVQVQEELRKLYSRDPDWNALLPELGDALTGEQRSLQEFLKGFTDFAKEIPLKVVRPALSTVVYTTNCAAWRTDEIRSGIPDEALCEQIHVAVNEQEHTAVVVTARRAALPWADVEKLFGWEWDLYVVIWWPEKRLLFINGSTNAGDFKSLAQAVAGEDVALIKGQEVFRSFHGVTRLTLNSVGLSEQLGRHISYTSRMGPDVAAALPDAQRRSAMKSVFSGTGFEGGRAVTIAASRKGRIWSHRRDNVRQLSEWCKQVGSKLVDTSIDPDEVLRGTLVTQIVTTRPQGRPVCVDWPEEVYRSIEKIWSVEIDGVVTHISELDLLLVDPTLFGPIRFAIAGGQARAEFDLEVFEDGGAPAYRFTLRGDRPVRVFRGGVGVSATEFFRQDPPRVWFADGALLEGNEYTPLIHDVPPYSKDKLVDDWDWSGIDIHKESQGEEKAPDSIQARVIELMKAGPYALIFDDDGAGEAADVVGVTLVGPAGSPERIEVDLIHCKYSKGSTAGHRVDDLYVVCGQAQTSIKWMSSTERKTDLFTHLLRRERSRRGRGAASRIELGDEGTIETLRQMSCSTRVALRISIVQPGVSKATISDAQLHLLSVTENYLAETYQIPFRAIVRP
jgi:superfamily II DNA or RNA helicase